MFQSGNQDGIVSGGFYIIENITSPGLVLQPADDDRVGNAPNDAPGNHLWRFFRSPRDNGRYYHIHSERHGPMGMMLVQNQKDDIRLVPSQMPHPGRDWAVEVLEGGTFQLTNALSGNDVFLSIGGDNKLEMTPGTDTRAQLWRLVQIGRD